MLREFSLIFYFFHSCVCQARDKWHTALDFLRQLSSMLQVRLSFENAMEDMSQYGEGPMYDEMILWF